MQVPSDPHYAIVEFSTYFTEEDGSVNMSEYIAYRDKTEWEADVTRLAIDKKNFVSMFVNPAKATLKVNVEITC